MPKPAAGKSVPGWFPLLARHGTVAVEVALTAPLLFVVFFASVEFARLNTNKNTVENAAYEGCREGILPGATETKCEDAAEAIMQVVGVTDAAVVVTPNVIAEDTPQVTVDINLNLQASHGFVLTPFIAGKTLQASCTLQRELMDDGT